MKKPAVAYLWMALLCCNQIVVATDVPPVVTGREYAETVLLLSNVDLDFRLGLKMLRERGKKSRPNYDVLAEITWLACSGKRTIQPDSLAWAAKVLGESKQGRYAGLIDQCLENITDKTAVRYLNLAKANLAGTSTSDPFVGGNIDLTQVRDQIHKNRKANPPSAEMKAVFEGLRSGQHLDDVYASLGAPDLIDGDRVSRGKAGFIVRVKIGSNRVVFHYENQGEVSFRYDDASHEWLLAEARIDNDLIWISQKGAFGSQMEVITSGGAQDLYELTRRLKRQKNPIDPVLLDRIADRIYFSQMETEDNMPNTLAHMCHLLEKSNNGKYKPLLLEVAEKAAHRGVRKHAAKVAEALPEPGPDRYAPQKLDN